MAKVHRGPGRAQLVAMYSALAASRASKRVSPVSGGSAVVSGRGGGAGLICATHELEEDAQPTFVVGGVVRHCFGGVGQWPRCGSWCEVGTCALAALDGAYVVGWVARDSGDMSV